MTNAILEDRLFFGEVVGVDAFNFVTGFEGDAEAVVDHEGGEFFAVDEDDAGVVFRGGGERLLGERRSGDEDALLARCSARAPANF